MTPTLYGRWQTRFFLMLVLGVPITTLFALRSPVWNIPFILLGYALILGFSWDVLYDFLMKWRWNRDWPPVFAFLAGGVEGAFLWMLTKTTLERLPPQQSILLGIPTTLRLTDFWTHYGAVWITLFFASLCLMHILTPRWRYRGGQWMAGW